MWFTLVYQGDLPPNGNAIVKWRIRRELEPQLRQLWRTPPFDEIAKYADPNYQPDDCYVGRSIDGIEYVPCISMVLDLRAELRIRLLSSSMPGGIVRSGDIDNRLKTLLDALSIPTSQQVPRDASVENDRRVICLLEDDKLVTRIDVKNDRLLAVPDGSTAMIALIEVHPIAFAVTTANIGVAV